MVKLDWPAKFGLRPHTRIPFLGWDANPSCLQSLTSMGPIETPACGFSSRRAYPNLVIMSTTGCQKQVCSFENKENWVDLCVENL